MTRVRNMGRILSAFLMLGISSMCGAQIYKYLGIEDGLSNRRIYRIQKDGRGYMWFLTQEGMDRYDGKRIRHYTVLDGNLKVAPQVNLNWLYTDTENTLWVVGRKGRIFHYDTLHDRFRMVYRIPGLQDDFATGMLCYAYMDRGDRIWLCQGDHIIRYDTRTGIAQRLVSRLRGDITAISETDGTNLFIGTVNGLFPVRERDGVLEALADTDSIRTPVSELYYHPGFCVDMLCGMQNMSRTGFFNKLKALTGHAPADYIRSMRLQYAAQLLREKDCSITEISDDSGFSDVRYFREVFRKYYGMSPSEYRNSMRG